MKDITDATGKKDVGKRQNLRLVNKIFIKALLSAGRFGFFYVLFDSVEI